MNHSAVRPIGPWATFGILMLISLVAWGMGSPELALVLTIGAVGALFVALHERTSVRHLFRRLPLLRHHV